MNKINKPLFNYYYLLLSIVISCILFDFTVIYFITKLAGNPIFNSEGYIERSKNALLTLEFFTSIKPFTSDFLYKIYGSNPSNCVIGQQILSSFCWIFLGFTVSLTINNKLLSIFSLILFSTLVFWWNIAGWTYIMRSESSAFSLFALWYAMVILHHQYRWRTLLLLLCVVTILFSFTRDNIPYFLLPFAVCMYVCMYVGNRLSSQQQRRGWLIYLIVVMILFISQAISAQIGARYQFPLINVILQRIIVDEVKTDYFVSHGMPVNDNFITQWKGQWASSHDWALYNDPQYKDFMDFTLHKGKHIYGLFLLTHIGYTLKSAWQNRYNIFTTNLAPKTQTNMMIFSQFWDLYSSATFLLGLMFIISLLFIRRYPYLFAVMLCITINGIFIYHADAMEVARHSLIVMIVLATVSMHTLVKTLDIIKLSHQ